MGMPDLLDPVYWTAPMARALSADGRRYEVVHGELLVTPAPSGWHQDLVRRLVVALNEYLAEHPVAHLFMAPADISWDQDTLVQPDVFVVDRAQARTMDWRQMRTLLLVVEVLSPSTARQDRFAKRLRYQEAAVPVYWIVDPDLKQVEVWSPEDRVPRMERERIEWWPPGADQPFRLELLDLLKPME